jgi:hypothetical protein
MIYMIKEMKEYILINYERERERERYFRATYTAVLTVTNQNFSFIYLSHYFSRSCLFYFNVE